MQWEESIVICLLILHFDWPGFAGTGDIYRPLMSSMPVTGAPTSRMMPIRLK